MLWGSKELATTVAQPHAEEQVYSQAVKRKTAKILPKLTEAEQDLLWHMERGYRLETDSLGGNPVLRRLKDDEVIRPASANRSTVKALQERDLIRPGKSRDPLVIVWLLRQKTKG
jgi:hypothetical protein